MNSDPASAAPIVLSPLPPNLHSLSMLAAKNVCRQSTIRLICILRQRKLVPLLRGSQFGSDRRLTPERALGVDVKRIERLARRHEQAIAHRSSEAEIGAALGELDAADQLALRVV